MIDDPSSLAVEQAPVILATLLYIEWRLPAIVRHHLSDTDPRRAKKPPRGPLAILVSALVGAMFVASAGCAPVTATWTQSHLDLACACRLIKLPGEHVAHLDCLTVCGDAEAPHPSSP